MHLVLVVLIMKISGHISLKDFTGISKSHPTGRPFKLKRYGWNGN